MPTLAPDDVLAINSAAQILTLPDGRAVIRHRAGVTLVGGLDPELLADVLAAIDGQRTIRELVADFAARIPEQKLLRLLTRLLPEGLSLSPKPALRQAGSPWWVGQGQAVERWRDALTATGIQGVVVDWGPAPSTLTPDVPLIVAIGEDVSYRELLTLQQAALSAGVPSLFLTVDPDGLRLGPTVIRGVTPCWVCAQLTHFRWLGLDPQALLAHLQALGTQRADAGLWHPAQVLGREVHACLTPGGAPLLLHEVLHWAPSGVRRIPLARHPDCPVCANFKAHAPRIAVRTRELRALAERQAATRELRQHNPPLVVRAGHPDGWVARVGIVGGGTAGYLAALALRRQLPHLEVTLIESSAIPVIGVGEATTPLMPQFLHLDLGLSIHELFRAVQPTFKLGIRFLWGEPDHGYFQYPFGPLEPLAAYAHDGNLRRCSFQSLLMSADAVPLFGGEAADWRPGFGPEIAYHLDNQRFVRYLQEQAKAFGVKTVDAVIQDAELTADRQEVQTLIAADGRRFSFDLYLDCSGFRSLLLDRALGSPFISFAASLPTDRAIVAAVPHHGHIRPYTVAEAMDAGWCWNTPQVEADHRGYVFCSAFASPEQAAAEMQQRNPGMGEWRLVKFQAGRHAHFIHGNVVALGNAYGFVEPLESTALHMLIRQIGLLVRAFPWQRGERGMAGVLNLEVGRLWDYLAWFLALHYKFNPWQNTPFWRHCRTAVEVARHGELLTTFAERGPLSYDRLITQNFAYPDPLWGPQGIDLILLGQHVPCRLPRPALAKSAWQQRVRAQQKVARRAVPHSRALAQLANRPEWLEALVAGFRAVGPAFGPNPMSLR